MSKLRDMTIKGTKNNNGRMTREEYKGREKNVKVSLFINIAKRPCQTDL